MVQVGFGKGQHLSLFALVVQPTRAIVTLSTLLVWNLAQWYTPIPRTTSSPSTWAPQSSGPDGDGPQGVGLKGAGRKLGFRGKGLPVVRESHDCQQPRLGRHAVRRDLSVPVQLQ